MSAASIDLPSAVSFLARLAPIILALFAVLYLLIVQPGPSGVVASLRLPDGSEYMVTQRCNWSAEPYTVSFYMRSPGDPWGYCYLDHQANRWFNVALNYDAVADVVTVSKMGRWQAALDRKRNTFSVGNGRPRHETPAPQLLAQPGYSFPEGS